MLLKNAQGQNARTKLSLVLCKHFFAAYAYCICFKGVENSNGKKLVAQGKKKTETTCFL